MPGSGRIHHPALARRVVPADAAAGMIVRGCTVGMSGFTGAGYPKEVPLALAQRIVEANAAGDRFKINVWTGASTAPELDGALAAVDGIELRLPYQSDPVSREKINTGQMEYIDVHLSHVAQMVWEGFLGHLDVALIEVSGITADGALIPSSSVGNNKTWIDQADAVILEVNAWQSSELDGMHDIYYGTALPPNRRPIELIHPGDRIGDPYLRCPPGKVIAVVETDAPDRNNAFTPPDEASRQIAGHLIEFLEHEVARGRLPAALPPVPPGWANLAKAALAELAQSRFDKLTPHTEVIQDG